MFDNVTSRHQVRRFLVMLAAFFPELPFDSVPHVRAAPGMWLVLS
jgi:hypothetical protein